MLTLPFTYLQLGEGDSVASGIKTWAGFLLGVHGYHTYVISVAHSFAEVKLLFFFVVVVAFLTDSWVSFLTPEGPGTHVRV